MIERRREQKRKMIEGSPKFRFQRWIAMLWQDYCDTGVRGPTAVLRG